jgi:RimJ/RimL family protein N-acetyltransferase
VPEPQPIIMLRGELVELGPLRNDLIDVYVRWMNDLDVIRTLSMPNMPMSREQEAGWLEHMLTSSTDATFTIYVRETGEPIGNCGLHNINARHGTAEYGIGIGEKSAWNKGYGTEVTRLMLAYGFDVLGLKNIWLRVNANNPWGVRAYEKAGFQRIGVRRSAQMLGRTRIDEILMDAIPEDFAPSDLQSILEDGPPRH